MSDENRLIKFGEGIEIDFDFIKRSQYSSENLTLEIQDIKSVALEIKKISNRQKLYVSNDSQIIPSSEGGKDMKRYYDQSQISSVVYNIEIVKM